MKEKAHGSGYFGEWIEDEFGLSAYHYTCDQINDPKAVSPVNEVWRSKTDHSHQVGNDRITAVASNYGYVQVRQDEGSPKFLNDYDLGRNQFAGGFGYLTDDKNFLSTYYPGNADSFDRTFGMGYYRKNVKGHGYGVDQVVFAPYGDDPILISQITITNNRKESVNLRWIEHWGCQMYQFSFQAYLKALQAKNSFLARQFRQEFCEQFKHDFAIIGDNEGLKEIKSRGAKKDINVKEISEPRPTFEDMNPPMTFLVSLDDKADGIGTDGFQFFGKGGVLLPDGLETPLTSSTAASGNESAMFLERKLHLKAGEKKTIFFAFGYIPEGFELGSLVQKYKINLSELWSKSSSYWKKNRIELKILHESWVDRELMWHNYYLRSAMTFDSYFKEHMLSQGHVYQYIIGFQGAARDPLQHALPFIYTQPEIVKEILRYIMKTINKDGQIPYGITGSGMIMPAPFKPSDLELWLLWLASEYVLATRDKNFLEEEIPTYPIYGRKSNKALVRDLLFLCYQHFVEITGTGRHGIQRLSNGDWNDDVVLGYVPEAKREEVRKHGESVLNSAMAIFSLGIYSEMLKYVGDKEHVDEIKKHANELRKGVSAQWNGKWFKRAWLTEDIGWIGEDEMWLEPQPWAIIGKSASPEQVKILIRSIDENVRKPSKIGALIRNKGRAMPNRPLGVGTNGGIWPSINGTLIWALSLVQGNLAWDEWKKNSLAAHAESYPEIWYGIWSGPDTYNSTLSKYPGQTIFDEALFTGIKKEVEDSLGLLGVGWTDFPVMNLHSHAWPLYTIACLIGVNFTTEGVELKPALPYEEYEFSSPLLGIKKSKNGYSGWYNPKCSGTWKIYLKLNEIESTRFKKLKVNDKEAKFVRKLNCLMWNGASSLEKPVRWTLE